MSFWLLAEINRLATEGILAMIRTKVFFIAIVMGLVALAVVATELATNEPGVPVTAQLKQEPVLALDGDTTKTSMIAGISDVSPTSVAFFILLLVLMSGFSAYSVWACSNYKKGDDLKEQDSADIRSRK